MPDGPRDLGSPVEIGTCRGNRFILSEQLLMGTGESWQHPLFYSSVLQEKARKLGENTGAASSELSAACEMS